MPGALLHEFGISIPFYEMRTSIEAIQYPAFVEIKLDGEFNWCVFRDNTLMLVNKYDRTRDITKEWGGDLASRLIAAKVHEAVFMGELFFPPGTNGCLYKFLECKNDMSKLNFRIFDMGYLLWQGQKYDFHLPLVQRKELMLELLLKHTTLQFMMKSHLVHDTDEVMQKFKDVTGWGAEGIVVKPINSPLHAGDWVKIKRKDTNAYPCTFVDPTRERIEVIVETNTTSGKLVRRVGVKVTNKDKAMLKGNGELVNIEHQGVLDKGGLRHPVYKGLA